MGYSSIIVLCTLAISGSVLADCTPGSAGDLSGERKNFQDISLPPLPYPQPVYFPNQCQFSKPASGLEVTACSAQDKPEVLVLNVENARITCLTGCIVSSADFCTYGVHQPSPLPKPIVSPLSSDRGSNRNVYYHGQ